MRDITRRSRHLLRSASRAAVAGALVLGAVAAQAQKSGGTFVYIVQPEPPSLASYLSTSGPIGLVAPKIYDGLFDYDNDLNIVPALATGYEVSEDGKTVTFKLREGRAPGTTASLSPRPTCSSRSWRS